VLIYKKKIGGLDTSLKRTTEERDKEKADALNLIKKIDELKKSIADDTKNFNEQKASMKKDSEAQKQDAQSK
jgi:hypothetical protein